MKEGGRKEGRGPGCEGRREGARERERGGAREGCGREEWRVYIYLQTLGHLQSRILICLVEVVAVFLSMYEFT